MTWGNPPLAPFGDELVAAKDYLRGALARPQLAGRPEVVGGVDVGLWLPSDYVPATSRAFVRVSRDGTPSATYAVAANRTMRVVAWHANTTRAKALAELCLALLLTYQGDEVLARCTFLTGVTPGTDPDNGGDIAAFTVRAEVRPTVI